MAKINGKKILVHFCEHGQEHFYVIVPDGETNKRFVATGNGPFLRAEKGCGCGMTIEEILQGANIYRASTLPEFTLEVD